MKQMYILPGGFCSLEFRSRKNHTGYSVILAIQLADLGNKATQLFARQLQHVEEQV